MKHGVVTELSFFLSCGRRTSLGGLDDGNIDESALLLQNPSTIKNSDGTRLAKIYRGIEVFIWLDGLDDIRVDEHICLLPQVHPKKELFIG